MLPFVLTSPSVSGTPAYILDPDAHVDPDPAIAAATPVYDNAGCLIGLVEGVEVNAASDRITRIIVRQRRRGEEDRALADRLARDGALSAWGRGGPFPMRR